MRVDISDKPLIPKATLEKLGRARLDDAAALLESDRYAAAIYLAGYAVECYLKVAICLRLDWEHLYPTFKIHELELLLLHSGLASTIQQEPQIEESFKKIVGVWKMEAQDNVRYCDPETYSKQEASAFIGWVNDPHTGVVPWLLGQS